MQFVNCNMGLEFRDKSTLRIKGKRHACVSIQAAVTPSSANLEVPRTACAIRRDGENVE